MRLTASKAIGDVGVAFFAPPRGRSIVGQLEGLPTRKSTNVAKRVEDVCDRASEAPEFAPRTGRQQGQ